MADRQDLAAIAERWNAHPGMHHLGARVTLDPDGTVRALLDDLQDHHRGGLGTDAVNGAVIAGLFDLVIGLAGYQHTLGRRAGVAQLNVRYLRPVLGQRVEVVGQADRVGRTLVFASARLLDQTGRVCAMADGLVAVAGGGGATPPADPEAVL